MIENSPRHSPQPDAVPAAPRLDSTAAHQAGAGQVLRLLREILETLALALLVFLVIQIFWRNFWVEGMSMEPNIHNGQYLVVNHVVYNQGFPVNLLRRTLGRSGAGSRLLEHFFHAPQRGDVIVFDPPMRAVSDDFIKRVVGLPGDKVEVRQGRLLINDRVLNEPYILPGPPTSWGPAYVGLGELFVMGDNRGNSTDSRSFGMLQQSSVIGQAWLCYWPPRHWGLIEHQDVNVQARGQ